MAKSLNLATLVALAVVATLLGHTSAATYLVADGRWTFNPNGTLYSTWASQHNFYVGDVLVFNFTTGFHTVATVTKESFDSCNKNNPIALNEVGPANIPLIAPGEVHFICTFGQHCASASQKLAINVIAAPTSSPPSSPPSIEPTPSPLPETPTPAATPPALGPGGPAPAGSVIPPTPAATPPALGPGGPAPIGVGISKPPTSSVSPPPQGNPPSSPGGDVPPTSAPPPSGATRTGLASIFTIFISAALCLLF